MSSPLATFDFSSLINKNNLLNNNNNNNNQTIINQSPTSSTTSSSLSPNSLISSLTNSPDKMVVHLPHVLSNSLTLPINTTTTTNQALFNNISNTSNGILPQNATPMDRLIMAAGTNAAALLNAAQTAQTTIENNQNNTNSQTNSGEASPGSSHSKEDISGDAEGVWSPDIDQAFHEALQIYPPCGRRKIILSDEGKMYGRNELIARYIKIRCGKTRTRKQVSSHIQVLARKKQRENQNKMKAHIEAAVSANNTNNAQTTGLKTELLDDIKPLNNTTGFKLPTSADPTAAAIPTSATVPNIWPYASFQHYYSSMDRNDNVIQQLSAAINNSNQELLNQTLPLMNGILNNREQENISNNESSSIISSSKLTLCGFEAYVQQPDGKKYVMIKIPKILDEPEEPIKLESIKDNYPPILEELFKAGPSDAFFFVKCWANIDFESGNPGDMNYAVDSYYDSSVYFDISVSTKVCSFGKQVVEKVEVYSPAETEIDGKKMYRYQLEGSHMCDYMVRFITELKKLEQQLMMNRVLDNFTVLQIISNKNTNETIMVIAFVFEVSEDPGLACRAYKIVQ